MDKNDLEINDVIFKHGLLDKLLVGLSAVGDGLKKQYAESW